MTDWHQLEIMEELWLGAEEAKKRKEQRENYTKKIAEEWEAFKEENPL